MDKDTFTTMLANAIAEALKGSTIDMIALVTNHSPAGFLVGSAEMREIVKMKRLVEQDKKMDSVIRSTILVSVDRLFKESKTLYPEDLEFIERGMELAHAEWMAHKASSTPEWINCY